MKLKEEYKILLQQLVEMNINDLENILFKINQQRDDIYLEFINNSCVDKNTIQACKDCEDSLLDLDRLQDYNCNEEETLEDIEDYKDNLEEELE